MTFESEIKKLETREYHTHNGIDAPKVIDPMFNLSKKAVQAGVTAGTTQTQAGGIQVEKEVVEISVCANAGDTLRLPFAVQGLQILIINRGANSSDIFPNVDDDINEVGADTAYALAADASVICTAIDQTHWECLIQARS